MRELLIAGVFGVGMNTIKRAFELAPQCASMDELRKALAAEGHEAVHAHLAGVSISRELRKLMKDGRGGKARGRASSSE